MTEPRHVGRRRKTLAAVDRDHGERIRLVKAEETNQYRPATDGIQVDLTAIVRFVGTTEDLGGDRNRKFASRIPAGEGRVMIDPGRFPAAHDIAQDDTIVLLDRAGEPSFRVGRIDPVSSSRLTVHLVK